MSKRSEFHQKVREKIQPHCFSSPYDLVARHQGSVDATLRAPPEKFIRGPYGDLGESRFVVA